MTTPALCIDCGAELRSHSSNSQLGVRLRCWDCYVKRMRLRAQAQDYALRVMRGQRLTLWFGKCRRSGSDATSDATPG